MGGVSRGDPRFHELLKHIGELHDKKQEDYGSDHDPFANVRASERWGISPWIGAMVRLNDKVHRLQQFAQKGELANESAEDSMMDIAVYALIALVLYREETAEALVYDESEHPKDHLTPHRVAIIIDDATFEDGPVPSDDDVTTHHIGEVLG